MGNNSPTLDDDLFPIEEDVQQLFSAEYPAAAASVAGERQGQC